MRPRGAFRPAAVFGLGVLLAGCTSVDVVRMTSQQFPPKRSADQVEVLESVPMCPHVNLAQLSVDESSAGFSEMQQKMLEKGAEMGADAVIFSKPEKEVQHQVAYEPTMAYSPFGMGGWGYSSYPYGYGYYGGFPPFGGMGGPMGMGMGYGGSVAVPYDVTVKSLKGLAIRYTASTGPKC